MCVYRLYSAMNLVEVECALELFWIMCLPIDCNFSLFASPIQIPQVVACYFMRESTNEITAYRWDWLQLLE